MGTLASGSIDLKSLKVAGEPNKYITYIDEDNGIRVFDGLNTNKDVNFTQINSRGMQLYLGGTSTEQQLASFGETIVLGNVNASHLDITQNLLSFYDTSPSEVFSIKPTDDTIIRNVVKTYDVSKYLDSYNSSPLTINLGESCRNLINCSVYCYTRYGPVGDKYKTVVPGDFTYEVWTNAAHTIRALLEFTLSFDSNTKTLSLARVGAGQSPHVYIHTVTCEIESNLSAMYLGAEDTSSIKLDFNSLQMISKEDNSYFKVEDLRNANGIANITENFSIPATTSNPETPNYTIGYSLKYLSALDNVQSVKLNDVSLSASQYTISSSSTGFIAKITSSANASVGDKLSISYTTQGVSNLQAFTFGNRDETHGYVPGAISVAMGTDIVSDGMYSIAIGEKAAAFGIGSSSQGFQTSSIGSYSHAEGWGSTSKGNNSHAEGSTTQAIGPGSHAEGFQTTARGSFSHAEGSQTTANGSCSHAEGSQTTAGSYSHAEGHSTKASGSYSHAEGSQTTARGSYSHAEGSQTTARGSYSHAEGYSTEARGSFSHAQNFYTVATQSNQTVIGKYNACTVSGSGTDSDPYTYADVGDYAFIIGNGTSNTTAERSNALTVDWNGNIMAQGMAGIIQMYAGSYDTVPPGWLLCDGRSLLIADYPELANALYSQDLQAYIYGAADSSHFNLPDFCGRVPIGAGTGTATDATLHILGTPGGTETVTLTANQSGQRALTISGGAHTHQLNIANSKITNTGSSGADRPVGYSSSGTHGYTSSSVGHTHSVAAANATEAHNNMQPYLVINYIICTGKTS